MTEKYCLLTISLCGSGTDEADCENCELNKRFVKRTIDNWESYIVDRKTEKEYGSDINPLINLLNEQEEEIQSLKQRNQRQYERLKEITDLMMERDWKSLEKIVKGWEQGEEQLEREWGTYGDVE